MYIKIHLFILLFIVSSFSFASENSIAKAEAQSQQEIKWIQRPVLKNQDLLDFPAGEYQLVIRIALDSTGKIKTLTIHKSSGLASLDQYVIQQVKKAKFAPYTENNIAYDLIADQPFDITIPEIKAKSWWRKLFWY